jgi:hypothetical protein
MAGQRVVYAKHDGWLTAAVYTHRGEAWAADDPVVAENPAGFSDDPESIGVLRRSGPAPAPVVEQATAAPGEKRTLPRRPRGTGE